MIHLIHGEDITSSRTFLLRLVDRFANREVIDARTLGKTEFWEKIAQGSLFTGKVVIIDWFEEKFLPFGVADSDKEIIIWSSQSLKSTSWADKINHFPVREISIFKLVDAFGLRRAALAQAFLEKTIYEKSAPEVILSMLVRQLKLISLSLSGEALLVSKSDFVRKKIADQAKAWNEKSLKRAFRILLETDLAIKNGLNSRLMLSLAIAKTSI